VLFPKPWSAKRDRAVIDDHGHLQFAPRPSRLRGTPVVGLIIAWRDLCAHQWAVDHCECKSCQLDRWG
jgi:hypothetical protein